MSVTYYPIDEELARRAKEMNSFSDYVTGSATQAYQRSVDRAAQIADLQKQRVDPIHHDKIDRLLDAYARKLAENINRSNDIAARVPSILISGGGNFPVRKKEKQNRAADANMEDWGKIQGLLDKIRSTGLGGISADDPEAVSKLEAKLEKLQQFQETMKAVNAYYRKNKTLDGCPDLSAEDIAKLKAEMARNWRAEPKPYESYALSNNNASIRQVKARIEELKKQAETVYIGWDFEGGFVDVDRAANRLQVFFDDKPEREVCAAMRHAGFRWAPSVGAWQRQLNSNAFYAADHLECIKPLPGVLPTELQKRAQEVVQEEEPAATAGSIAARYCDLLQLCYPIQQDDTIRAAQTKEVAKYLLAEGKRGANQMSLAAAGFGASFPDNAAVQELASALIKELAQYDAPGRDDVPQQKAVHKKSQER